MLKHRLVMGIIFVLLFIGALWLDETLDLAPMPQAFNAFLPKQFDTWPPNVILFPLALVFMLQGARELAAMFRAKGVMASRRWLAFASMLGLTVCALVPRHAEAVDAVALVASAGVAVLLTSMLWHLRDRELNGATAATGAALFAFIYLGLMCGFYLALRRDLSAWSILAVLLITKSCDIGAYFTGKALGRHKLIPWLSPGKTWEGLAGGLAFSAFVCWGMVELGRSLDKPLGARPFGLARLEWYEALVFGMVLGLVGQAGDLLESVLKRDAGIKDAGSTLPGFGGVLDVSDSVLLAAPIAYWVLTSVENGGAATGL